MVRVLNAATAAIYIGWILFGALHVGSAGAAGPSHPRPATFAAASR